MKSDEPFPIWPIERGVDWTLQKEETVEISIERHPNKKYVIVVANMPLMRAITVEMMYWWFQHTHQFPVRIQNVGNYEDGDIIP